MSLEEAVKDRTLGGARARILARLATFAGPALVVAGVAVAVYLGWHM